MKYLSVAAVANKVKYKDREIFMEVINKIFEKAKEQLYARFQVKVLGLGRFYIQGIKMKNKIVDYGQTRKLGKVVYYTNFHSGRVRYEIRWRDRRMSYSDKFVPYRYLNRDLKKIITDE
jgi:nucleoid DNA-binding protein